MPVRRLVVAVLAFCLLVFAGALVFFSLSGGDEPEVTSRPTAATSSGAPSVATGPGRLVAVVAGPRQPESYLHLVGLDGSGSSQLTERRTRLLPADASPVLSPDGTRMAFVRSLYEPGSSSAAVEPHVYVARADGTRIRRLTQSRAPEIQPTWAPDGRTIAFARSTAGGFALFAADLLTGRVYRMTHESRERTDDVQPAWSPAGRHIAFTAYVRDNEDLFLADAAHGSVTPLLSGPSADSLPDWSPDGERLVFIRNGGVHVVNADGTGARALTREGANDSEPQWSRDGRRVLFSREGEGLMVIDVDGENLARVNLDDLGLVYEAAWAP